MSAQITPPARRSSWLKPVLIIIAIVMLIIGLGIASLVGIGWYGWNTVQKSIATHSKPPRQLSADEEAIIEMVLEREMGEPGTATASEPELELLTEVLAAHYQKALAHHANGTDPDAQETDKLQQALALIASTMQDKSALSSDEAALSPELELLLEALLAHRQHQQKEQARSHAE